MSRSRKRIAVVGAAGAEAHLRSEVLRIRLESDHALIERAGLPSLNVDRVVICARRWSSSVRCSRRRMRP
jgi:hypothetical protein